MITWRRSLVLLFSYSHYGVIKVDHFCGLAVNVEQNAAKCYAFSTYYLPRQRNVYEAHITVTPNLDLHLKVGLRSVINIAYIHVINFM